MGRPLLTVIALLVFAACSDRQVTGPMVRPVLTGRVLSCTADVGARTLSCTAPPVSSAQGGRGISADLILGGQGTYVALRSSNVSYNGTSTFQADVTVQNLTAQPLGTPDGSTVSGVKVFFYSGPTVTAGTGTVTVANADGTDAFTGTNQPYFFYNQILQTAQVSAAKTWRWAVPSTVVTFTFQVLVDAATPQPQTVLRWLPQADGDCCVAVWGSASNDVFAVAFDGTIWHYGGTRWSAQPSPTTDTLWAVWGTGATDVFAVGSSGTILHYDGISWSAQSSGTAQPLHGVWGTSGTDVYAVGFNATILHYDGTSWSAQPSATTEELNGV